MNREPMEGFKHICPICGKEFYGGSEWKFKRRERVKENCYTMVYFCTWKCFRAEERAKEAKERAKSEKKESRGNMQIGFQKEQETVIPKKVKGYNPPTYTLFQFRCEKCESPMMYRQPFCMGCGRPVKWEGVSME